MTNRVELHLARLETLKVELAKGEADLAAGRKIALCSDEDIDAFFAGLTVSPNPRNA
jgi:hypothetical protein